MGKISPLSGHAGRKDRLRPAEIAGPERQLSSRQVALTICKDFMGRLTLPKTVICVTGTNGKTTVSNLLTGMLGSAAIPSPTTPWEPTFRPVSARRCWMTPPLAGPSGKTLRCWKSTSAALC